MNSEKYTEAEWLERMYKKSRSEGTRRCAKTALTVF